MKNLPIKNHIMKKIYFLLPFVMLFLAVKIVYSQSYFKPVGDFTNAMNINILQAKVNNINLVAGDEIAIFDGTVCVGAVILTKELGIVADNHIAPSKAGANDGDTPAKDGYIIGNAILFKMYDKSEDEEIPLVISTFHSSADLSVLNPSPTFDPEVTAFVALTATHNYKPKAKAGSDQSLNEELPGQLDGSASSDLESSPLTFKWKDIDNLGLSALNVNKPTFTAPIVNVNTNYRVELIVNDGEKDSKPDTVIVTVKQVHKPPVANAGADFEIAEGIAGKLDASSTYDPDGLGFSFSWVIVPSEITLDDVNSAKPNFTAPMVTIDKEYLAILTVTNTIPLSSKDTVKIKVINYNIKPIANAGADVEKDEGVNVVLNGSASSDPDNAPNAVLTYSWTSVQGITINNATTVSPDFVTPFYLKDSLLHFILVVNDGGINSNPDTVVVKVKHKNLDPTANAGADFSVNENTAGQLNGSVSSDLDGTITYLWTVTGITLTGANTVNPTFSAPEVQADSVITFTLTVTDDKLATDVDAVDVTIKHVNKKPVANAGTYQEVDENVVVTLDGSLSKDPDMNDAITYKWVAPQGISLDDVTAQKPKFTTTVITEDFIDYVFKLVVNDGTVNSDTSSVIVRLVHLNIPPVANAGTDILINENTGGTLNGSLSSDFENKPLTYIWTAPAVLALNDPTSVGPGFMAPEVHKDTVFTVYLKVNDGVRNSQLDSVKITVKHINKVPVANAGTDQTVSENVLVQLDGSASFDLDAYDVITYSWTSLDGAVLSNNEAAKPTFTTPWLLKDSVYRFNLVVNDGIVNSVTDMVSVTVKHANLRPIADAGAATLVVNENTTTNLNGSASSDPEGKALSFVWSAPVGISITNPNVAVTTFTAAEVEADTNYDIVLTVNDGETLLNTHKDTIKVTVKQVNKAPVANAGADKVTREQKPVMLDGSASYDPDALDIITFSWAAPVGVTLDDATAAKPNFIAGDVAVDTDLQFILTVTDNLLASDKDTVVVKVTANKAPIADAGANQKVRIKNPVTLHGENSSDPDGDVITYNWTSPAAITLTNPASANPTFIAPDSNIDMVYTFTLEVTDELGSKNSKTIDVTVISNLPPVIVTETIIYVFEGETVTLDASASTDPDDDVIIFEWFHADTAFIKKAPIINKNSSIAKFVAPQVESLTYIPVIIRAYDGAEDAYEVVKVYVKDIINLAPVANAGADIMVNEGALGTLDGSSSSDVEGKPITFLWTSGYLVLSNNKVVKPTFTAPEVKTDTTVVISLVVNDGKLSSTPSSVKVTIKNVNKAPVAKAGADIVVNEGAQISVDGSASMDPDGDALTYKWNALGFSITGADLAKATSKAPEVHKDVVVPFVLVVNDGKANSLPDTVLVTIKQVNKSPLWMEVPTSTALIGYSFSATIKVADPDLLDKIKITASNLPSWLKLTDKGDGTATISTDSIPRNASLLGSHTFAIQATDGLITIDASVKLTITVKTGIEDLLLGAVKFYPNPATGVVNVEFSRLPEMGTTIHVYNQLGQSVHIRRADSSINQLNLSDCTPGIYYIKVISEKASRTEKVILR